MTDVVDRGGHFYGDAFSWIDLNDLHIDGHCIGLDHLITNSGTVLVRVNGQPTDAITSRPDRHADFDETGGVPAGGF